MPEKIKKHIPYKYYLIEMSPYRPLRLDCEVCNTTSSFCGHMRMNTSNGCIYLWHYQCQDCGKLTYSDEKAEKGTIVALQEPCECGGQFRRDKNIFCTSCHYRKSDENKFEEKLTATKKQLEAIKKSNDAEEMTLPFEKSDFFEFVKE